MTDAESVNPEERLKDALRALTLLRADFPERTLSHLAFRVIAGFTPGYGPITTSLVTRAIIAEVDKIERINDASQTTTHDER